MHFTNFIASSKYADELLRLQPARINATRLMVGWEDEWKELIDDLRICSRRMDTLPQCCCRPLAHAAAVSRCKPQVGDTPVPGIGSEKTTTAPISGTRVAHAGYGSTKCQTLWSSASSGARNDRFVFCLFVRSVRRDVTRGRTSVFFTPRFSA